MSTTGNPFIRGYYSFHVSPLLSIASASDTETVLVTRPLHAAHAELEDPELRYMPCDFGDNFALVTGRKTAPDELLRDCPKTGLVLDVAYSIIGEQAGSSTKIGNAESAEAAQEVVRQLSFDAGRYNRCWEISARHLTYTSLHWLGCYAEGRPPSDLLVQAFHIPESGGAIGCRLLSTPWTDAHLIEKVGFDCRYLRGAQEQAKMPLNLIQVLQQASEADVRILIFDPEAPELEGLPVHVW